MIRFLLVLVVTFCLSSQSFAGTYYDKASDLYKLGPSHAPEIITLLKQALEEDPDDRDAVKLLGITYYHIGDFENAITQFDGIIDDKTAISPSILMYKAYALTSLCKNKEALAILDIYNAFWAESDQEYASLHADLNRYVTQGSCFSAQKYDDLESAAKAGDVEAQVSMGVGYAQEKKYSKAKIWWLKASAQGHDGAQYNLGLLYKGGMGVDKDYIKAFEWFEKSAIQGNPDAQNTLGVMYFKGQGTPQSFEKAEEWYKKAAEQGHPMAKKSLLNNKKVQSSKK